jgi:copper chaperone CopZ
MSLILAVSNIHCESCAKRVTLAIQKAEPEAKTTVDVATGRVTVENGQAVEAIVAALEKAGYPATQAA